MHELFDKSEKIILIVDDNPVNNKMLQTVLEKNGYRTISAGNGDEGIKTAKQVGPDLILLDIQMPIMNGIEACKILRQDKRTKDIPILFVTADTDDAVLKEAFDSGGTDYVRKPVNRIELFARMESALTHQMITKKLVEDEKLKGVLEMAGAVCHELNQPMQAGLGYSELLLMDAPREKALYSTVKKIRKQINRMSKITAKLMQITRYESKDYIAGTRIIDIDKASNG